MTVTEASSGEDISLYRTAAKLVEAAGARTRNRDLEAVKEAARTDQDARSRAWTLRAEGGARCDIVETAGADGAVRVSIETAPLLSYDLQLNCPHLRVTGTERYAVEFRARADAPRSIGVGFAEAHQPWQNLGWFQTVELTGEWREFRADFVATRNDGNGRIHFDLGGSGESVEFAGVRLLHVRSGAVVEPVLVGDLGG